MNKSILITGANIGLGKETARQLATLSITEKIYLACRNPQKAEAAKLDLEKSTGRKIFEVAIMDTTDVQSVKSAVSKIPEVDGIILNAGGMGGKNPEKMTPSGMNFISATNLLGHVVLVDELIKTNKLKKTVVYVSSEAARGITDMKMYRPELKNHSVEEYKSILTGKFFGQKLDPSQAYGHVKYVGTLWIASMARKHPNLKFTSVSPGATKGTAVADDIPLMMKFMFKYVMFPIIMPLKGMVHGADKGAKRYVDVLNDSQYKSGEFYASTEKKVTGNLVEQGPMFSDFGNASYQDKASEAIRSFIN